jgi:hypothetical protein
MARNDTAGSAPFAKKEGGPKPSLARTSPVCPQETSLIGQYPMIWALLPIAVELTVTLPATLVIFAFTVEFTLD